MANFKTHALVGGEVGFAAYCVKHAIVDKAVSKDAAFDFVKAMKWAGVCCLAACLPDILEPATSPNHRGFFHSVLVLFGIVWCLVLGITGSITMTALRGVAALGYASHLFFDALTPRRLPWF